MPDSYSIYRVSGTISLIFPLFMKKLFFILLPVLVLAGLGVWFWSLASVPEEEVRTVTLLVEAGGVSVRGPNLTNWEAAENGMELGEGWSVRTDGSGRASINFYGVGESRLSENAEVTITTAMIDAANASDVNVDLELKAGRLWSRVLKLFDLDSVYAVRASAVVATVRGTAFDVALVGDDSVRVAVNESAVDVREDGSDAGGDAIAAGYVTTFDAQGLPLDRREITEEMRSADWFRSNVAADEAFVEAEMARRVAALRRLEGPGADSVLAGAASLSERVHLLFARKDTEAALAEQYLTRRYMRLIDLVEAGKAGLAAQEFARLENYIRTELQDPEDEAERARIRSALERIAFIIRDADPDSPLFPFKQRLERLIEALAETDAASLLYVRLLALDARLDESIRFIRRGSLEGALVVLNGVRSGIENGEREARTAVADLSPERQRAVYGKIGALRAREAALRARLEVAMQPPEEETATSTEDGVSDDVSGPNAPSETAAQPDSSSQEEPAVRVTAITLAVQPSPIAIGKSANLIVTATGQDGTKHDVSDQATFTLRNAIGVLNGPTFTARSEGSTTINAQFYDGAVTHEASAGITVEGGTALEALRVLSSAGSVIPYGGSTLLTVRAVYNDGYEKDVTTLASYEITSGSGTLSGHQFTGDGEPGTVSITATYTEEGKTVEGFVSVTVQDPQVTGTTTRVP